MGQLLDIKKWDQYYYKAGQLLYYKLKRFYYKVEQVLQSRTVLLQSWTGITKWDDYYNVGFNKVDQKTSMEGSFSSKCFYDCVPETYPRFPRISFSQNNHELLLLTKWNWDLHQKTDDASEECMQFWRGEIIEPYCNEQIVFQKLKT